MTTEQNKSPRAHSPAPWTYQNDGFEVVIFSADSRPVAYIDGFFGGLPEDGILMAAAPELLEALEACCERFRREIAADDLLRGFFADEISPAALLNPLLIPQHGCIPQFLQICAAIAKARGQQ